jgi:ATP-dependent Clp endopeptidase proteolytic subunit ClpP
VAKSWYAINKKADDSAEVMLYDEIGMWGISANSFVRDFNAIDAKTITIRINSVGGSIFDGLAIYAAIKAHTATVNCKVDALAASIASVIAMAGDKITVAKNAFMMIHNGMVMAFGDAADLRKEAETIDKLTNKIAEIYAGRSGKPVDEIKAKMDAETWFDASECKEYGLCDDIGDDDDDGEALNMIVKASEKFTMPPKLLKYAAKLVAKPPIKETPPMAEKIIQRDGKHFVNVGGKEIEVEVIGKIDPAPAPAPAPVASLDAGKIATDAVAAERAYRAEFDTAMSTAGITSPESVKEFQKFYGTPIDQVKYLATSAIALRAKPVGEGGAGNEKPAAEKAAEEFEKKLTARFAAENKLRAMFGVTTNDAADETYKNGLGRFIRAEKKYAAEHNPTGKALVEFPRK